MPGFDFDPSDIAARYDRCRNLPFEAISQWLEEIATYLSGARSSAFSSLDAALAASRLRLRAVPLDLFEKMLAVAAHSLVDSGTAQVRGAAEALLFSDRSFDVVFVSIVLHRIRWLTRHLRSSAGA